MLPKELTARLSSQGQITVPVEIRRKLSIAPGDLVRFRIDDNGISLQQPIRPLHAYVGSIPAVPGVSHDFDDEIDQVWTADVVRRFGPEVEQ